MPTFPYIPPQVITITDVFNRYKIGDAEPIDFDGNPPYKSLLGTPVYSTLEFLKTGALQDFEPVGLAKQQNPVAYNTKGDSVGGLSIFRIDEAILTINQGKRIVRTEIAGRDGSIKEYIGLGDYEINVVGMLVGKYPNVYPIELVEMFQKIATVPDQIQVANQFLSLFDIFTVVVESFTIREQVGSRNVVPFTMNLISDDTDATAILRNEELIW